MDYHVLHYSNFKNYYHFILSFHINPFSFSKNNIHFLQQKVIYIEIK